MIVIYTNVVVDHAINHAMPMGNGAWGVRCDGTHAHVHVYMYRMFLSVRITSLLVRLTTDVSR
jgi:hypothetical protein